MSLSDLYEQLSILRARALTASSMNSAQMLRQINVGIKQCESYIDEKSKGDTSITVDGLKQ
jgi:predicted RNA-binding protein with PIN domain